MTAAVFILCVALVMTVLGVRPFFIICGKNKKSTQGGENSAAGKWAQEHGAEIICAYAFDGRELRGTLVSDAAAVGTLVLFHDWHSSWQRDFGERAESLFASGYNLLLVDERAHGRSKGGLTTLGVKEENDVESWVIAASQLFGAKKPIYLMGRGMGATAAVLASDRELGDNVRGIIAEAGFDSPKEQLIAVFNEKKPKHAYLDSTLAELTAAQFFRFSFGKKTCAEALDKSAIPLLRLSGAESYEQSEGAIEAFLRKNA